MVYIKTYIVNQFYYQHLVLLTMVPRNAINIVNRIDAQSVTTTTDATTKTHTQQQQQQQQQNDPGCRGGSCRETDHARAELSNYCIISN